MIKKQTNIAIYNNDKSEGSEQVLMGTIWLRKRNVNFHSQTN